MDNSNYDNFHGGGDFSHAYVIMHKYFGKKQKINKIHKFIYIQLNMFSCMKFHTHFANTWGPQILSLVNTKNQSNRKI